MNQLHRRLYRCNADEVVVAEVKPPCSTGVFESLQIHRCLVPIRIQGNTKSCQINRLNLFRPLTATVQESGAIKTHHGFLRPHGKPVNSHRLHIGVLDTDRLSRVHEKEGPEFSASFSDWSNIGDETRRERHGRHGDQAGPIIHEFFKTLSRYPTVIGFNSTDLHAKSLVEVHPWIDVVGVLQFRTVDNVVSRFPRE